MQSLIGSWNLVGWYREGKDGIRLPNGGQNPRGRLTYTEDGYMHAILVSDGRPEMDGGSVSRDNKVRLFETIMAYSGTYRIEGNRIVHSVDLSWNEVWSGTDKIRFFTLEGNRLTVATAPVQDLYDGSTNVYVVEWMRSTALRR